MLLVPSIGWSVASGGGPSFIDTTDLVAYWRLDGDATDAFGSFNGTASNISWASAFNGQGATFNGSSSDISFTAPNTAIGSGDFSFAAWFNPSSVSGVRDLITFSNTSGGIRCAFNSTTMVIIESSGSSFSIGSSGISTGNWFLCVWTKSGTGSNNVTGYINGSSVGTASISTTTTNSGTMYLGRAGSGSERLNGVLDECSLWARALTAGEITSLYNGGTGLFLP